MGSKGYFGEPLLYLHCLKAFTCQEKRLIQSSFQQSWNCCLCNPSTFIVNVDCDMSREKYIASRRDLKIGLSTF